MNSDANDKGEMTSETLAMLLVAVRRGRSNQAVAKCTLGHVIVRGSG
jgi:hypothetical protein